MTIGPAPIIKMLSISVRLGIFVHQRDKPFEEVMAVLRAGARFRMMLDRKHRLADDPQSLIGLVEKRQMRGLDTSRQAIGVDDEAAVLAGDLDRAGKHILDRMIGTAMPSRVVTGFLIARVDSVSSARIALIAMPIRSSRTRQLGSAASVMFMSDHSPSASLSQVSSHHAMVTRSPNQ